MFSACVRDMVLVRGAGRAYAEEYSWADSAHVGERRQSLAVGLGVSRHTRTPHAPPRIPNPANLPHACMLSAKNTQTHSVPSISVVD